MNPGRGEALGGRPVQSRSPTALLPDHGRTVSDGVCAARRVGGIYPAKGAAGACRTVPRLAVLAHGGDSTGLGHAAVGDLPRFTLGAGCSPRSSWTGGWSAPLLVVTGLYLWGVWRLRLRGDRWPAGRTRGLPGRRGRGDRVRRHERTGHLRRHHVLACTWSSTCCCPWSRRSSWRSVRRSRWRCGPPPGRCDAALLAAAAQPARPGAVLSAGGLGVLRGEPVRAVLHRLVPGDPVQRPCCTNCCICTSCSSGACSSGRWSGYRPVARPGSRYPFRFLILVSTLPFHAILGPVHLHPDHPDRRPRTTTALHLAWLDPVSDQRVGGGLLWSSGEIVGLIMLGVVTAQWMQGLRARGGAGGPPAGPARGRRTGGARGRAGAGR